MLTCTATFAGFLLVLGVGGAVVEHTSAARWLDRFARDLPMNWVSHSRRFEDNINKNTYEKGVNYYEK